MSNEDCFAGLSWESASLPIEHLRFAEHPSPPQVLELAARPLLPSGDCC